MKKFLKNLKHGFTFFGQCVVTTVNTVLLLIVYVLGVGLTALAAKCAKKHFLVLDIDHKSPTYWQDCEENERAMSDYYRQF